LSGRECIENALVLRRRDNVGVLRVGRTNVGTGMKPKVIDLRVVEGQNLLVARKRGLPPHSKLRPAEFMGNVILEILILSKRVGHHVRRYVGQQVAQSNEGWVD
jgi:hypothetical protein